VVVTIHGIRTHGKWQKDITPYLAKHGLTPYHIDFGWFNTIKFLIPYFRNRQLKKIRDELRRLVTVIGTNRFSIIAHSFGTYLAMEALKQENGGFSYDRVVLTGSIVPIDLDWSTLFEQTRVVAVRSECASKDYVVYLASFASCKLIRLLTQLNAGKSGRIGFSQKNANLIEAKIDGGHSETHNDLKFEQWARFIAYPILPDDILSKITAEMAALRQNVAKITNSDPINIRVNLFAPINGVLRIVPGATENMFYVPELDIEINLGHGATGTAFKSCAPCLSVRKNNFWSGNSLPENELKKVNPYLTWVLSIPVISNSRNICIGVLNIDGLNVLPQELEDSTSEQCKVMITALSYGTVNNFEPILDAAFRGESYFEEQLLKV
jgi:pimeloyl-ACP methyl ester carboxylesterase